MVLMVLDALSVFAGGCAGYYFLNRRDHGLWQNNMNILIFSVLLVVLVNNFILGRMRLYSSHRPDSYWKLIWTIFKAVSVDFIFLVTLTFLVKQKSYPRTFLFYFMLSTFLFLMLERLSVSLYIDRTSRNGFNTRRLLVVGEESRAAPVIKALERQLSWGHHVVGNLSVTKNSGAQTPGGLEKLPEILKEKEVDEVIFALGGDRSIKLWKYLDVCRKMGITTRILPALWDAETQPIRVEELQGIPFLTVHVNNFSVSGLLYKRILDITGGLIGTIIFLIIYPFVGIAIKIDSPGPVLFKQKRVGKNGRIFQLLKFRSMYVDAEKRKGEFKEQNVMEGPMYKLKDDPRITRVGRFLRRMSLDEVPQFLNVLKGEMSLVGTRPPTPEEVKSYGLWHHRRISAKPGITGLWQVSGRNKIKNFSRVVELDCQYLDNWRFLDDLKILFKTVFVVLARKGAF